MVHNLIYVHNEQIIETFQLFQVRNFSKRSYMTHTPSYRIDVYCASVPYGLFFVNIIRIWEKYILAYDIWKISNDHELKMWSFD